MANKLKVALLLGSVRPGRMCDRVAKFIKTRLEDGNFEVVVVDPKEYQFPLLETPLHFYQDRSKAPEQLHALNKIIQSADALVLLACEYNQCISPALSNLIDHTPPPSYAWKPSAIVSYSLGRYAGISAASQLRLMMAELNAPTIPTSVSIAQVSKALAEDGTSQDDHLEARAGKFIHQLRWYAEAMVSQKAKSPPPS